MLLSDLAGWLVVRGWDVQVVYSGDVEWWGGGWALRSFGYAGAWVRLALGGRRARPPDVVVIGSDPPMLHVAGPWLGDRFGAPVVHWCQDLYPEAALALGVVGEGGIVARSLRSVARRSLGACSAVVVNGSCMADRAVEAGGARDTVAVVPNWPLVGLRPGPSEAFRHTHGLSGRFVVMYSGTLGLAHPFSAVLDAAARLDPDPDIVVVVVGGGRQRAAVEAEAHRRRLRNVRFLDRQPQADLRDSLSAADLHLVVLDPALAGLSVPSKTYGALAVGRPVVFLGPEESEVARLLDRTGAGETLPVDDGARLADAVRAWKRDPARREAAGARAASAMVGARERSLEAFEATLRRAAGL